MAITVDEAHCISQWGLPGSSPKRTAVPFRIWYGNLGELKSLTVSNVPSIIVTATASLSTKRDIFRALNLNQSSSFIMDHSPERPNVQFSVRYLDKNLPVSSIFSTLIDELRSKNVSCERTMIFCQTRRQYGLVYSAFKESLGVDFYVNKHLDSKTRMVEIFHAGTSEAVKKHIFCNMSQPNGHIRIVACTVAFGMGLIAKKFTVSYILALLKTLNVMSKNVEGLVEMDSQVHAFCCTMGYLGHIACMTNNMLKLNQEKTELIVISSKFRPKPAISYVSVGDKQILPKSSARNLGVIFDECCNMVEHVNKICKTSYYHLRNISKIRKYLTEETTEILVHAFVTSKLDYCNSLLYGLPKHMIGSLQSVQNTAARIVTLTKKFDHITPVLIQLHWLPVHFRILFKVLLLVYKALNGMAPLYITELLSYRTCSRTLRSTDQKHLVVPKSRLKTYGDRTFSVAAPKLWNELPLDLRSLVTINLFKKHLKTDLFKKAYNI